MVACNKINKTRRCAGRLRASIRLKCEIKFTIKKVLFFNQSWTFPPKFFGVDSIPNMAVKQSTKYHKRAIDSRDCYQRESLHFIQDQRPLTPYQPTPQSTQPSPWHFFTTGPRLLIAYQPTPHHRAPRNQANQPRTTYTHSLPDSDLVEEESVYLF